MKKLFVALSILVATIFGTCSTLNSGTIVFAENETSEVVESSSEPSESEEPVESETELEPINVDEEVSKISQTARDVIEVIKTVLSQPIVIGGVSVSLGTILLFVLGKVFGNLLSKRNSKYDKKIAEYENRITNLLKQVGVSEQAIKDLKDNYEKLLPIIEEMIQNTKNIQVKAKLNALYEETKQKTKETTQEVAEQVEEQNYIPKSTQDTIKELLEK